MANEEFLEEFACAPNIPIVPIDCLPNDVPEGTPALVDKGDGNCCFVVKKPGGADTGWAPDPNNPVGGNIYDEDGTLAGNRTVTMAGNDLNLTGGDVNIGTPGSDESNLYLVGLEGNSPKEDCSTSTPLGYDNSTGLVVPMNSGNGYVYTFKANDTPAMVANGATISPGNPGYITNSVATDQLGSELTFILECESIVEFKIDLEQSLRNATIIDGQKILFRNRIVVDGLDTGAYSNTNEKAYHSTNSTSTEVRKSLHLIRTLPAGTHTVSYKSNLLFGGQPTFDWQNTQVMISAKWWKS